MKFKEYIIESINDKGIFKAIILGGLPAAGKTTVIKKVISNGSFPISIPDADYWTEKHGGVWSPENKRLTNSTYHMTINSLRPLYIDTVSGNPEDFKNRVNDLKSIGYDVDMVFVDIDVETAIKRVKKRNIQQNRQVSTQYIINTYNKIYGGGKYKKIDATPLFKQYSKILGKSPIIVNGKVTEWNDTTKKVYNKVTNFLKSPIKNKKGQKLVDFMRKKGYKYYMDIPEEWLIGNGYPRLNSISYYKNINW